MSLAQMPPEDVLKQNHLTHIYDDKFINSYLVIGLNQ